MKRVSRLLFPLFLLVGIGGVLTQCEQGYINLSEVPDREPPRIPLAEVRQDLKELTKENAEQKAFGSQALGSQFTEKK